MARWVVSSAPRLSIRRSMASSSAALISAMGRLPIHGKTSLSSRRKMRSPWLASQFGENFPCHSRAIASKLSAPACDFLCLARFAWIDAAASCWREASRLSRARSSTHVGIDAEGKSLLLAAKAILPAPPLPTGRANLQIKPAAIEHFVSFLSWALPNG